MDENVQGRKGKEKQFDKTGLPPRTLTLSAWCGDELRTGSQTGGPATGASRISAAAAVPGLLGEHSPIPGQSVGSVSPCPELKRNLMKKIFKIGT